MNDDLNGKNSEVEKKLTLSEYIEKNQKLITVIGVFTALAIFSQNVNYDIFRSLLSFLFTTLTVIVWVELLIRRIGVKANWRLRLFDFFLSFTIFVFIGYWFIEYFDFWSPLIFIPLVILLNTIFAYILNKLGFISELRKPKSQKFKKLKRTFFYLIVFTLIFLSAYLAGLLSKPVIQLLKELKIEIQPLINN